MFRSPKEGVGHQAETTAKDSAVSSYFGTLAR